MDVLASRSSTWFYYTLYLLKILAGWTAIESWLWCGASANLKKQQTFEKITERSWIALPTVDSERPGDTSTVLISSYLTRGSSTIVGWCAGGSDGSVARHINPTVSSVVKYIWQRSTRPLDDIAALSSIAVALFGSAEKQWPSPFAAGLLDLAFSINPNSSFISLTSYSYYLST